MKIKKRYYCLMDSNNKPDFRYLFTNKIDAEKKRKEIKNSTVGETLFVSKNKRDFFVDGVRKKFIGENKLINIKKGCWVTLKTKQLFILDTIQPEIYFQKVVRRNKQTAVNYNLATQKILTQKDLKYHPSSFRNPQIATPKIKSVTKNQTLKQQRVFADNFHDSQIATQATKRKATAKQNIPSKTTKLISTPKKENSKRKSFNLLTPRDPFAILKTRMFAFNFAVVLLICIISVVYFNNKSHRELATAIASKQEKITKEVAKPTSDKVAVLGAMKEKGEEEINTDLDRTVFETLQEFDKIKTEKLAEKIQQMVAGTPMEQMVPYIAKQDKIVAAFLVGIAKKESNYGRRVPVLNGKDCYNYWGYRGIRKRMGTGGHTCFDSPEDAVKTVGGRISRLVKSGVDTPQEMVLWKCGSDCNSTGGWPAAHKWISDVNLYYSKMIDLTNEDDPPSDDQANLNNENDNEKQVLSLQG